MTAVAATIAARALSKRYGGPPVLDQVDLSIAAGEIVAIMGRSGSGKSTLLKLIGALDVPDSGSVNVDGQQLADLTEDGRTRFRRARLGYVFQFFNLIPTLTVEENVSLPLMLNRCKAETARQRVDELLGALDLQGRGSRFPDELSGGEQQRVAIARALSHRPGVIIADEPTGNLDGESAATTLELLERACRATPATLIIATHSVEAAGIADRVLHLRNGRLQDD